MDRERCKWTLAQLTTGTKSCRYHSHSYYDISVFDSSSRYIAAHQSYFSERQPEPDDPVAVGFVDCESDVGFIAVGESKAWSWQQGPMAQWLPTARSLIWNDRAEGEFVTRCYDFETSNTRTLRQPTYAVAPDGDTVLSLAMGRLDVLRPGYGYAGRAVPQLASKAPEDDGVWCQKIGTGESTLILSVSAAVEFLYTQLSNEELRWHRRSKFFYWFNHAKISPDGERFTVKLRFRELDGGWDDRQGVSLTCGMDGSDLRYLASATSHVIWLDSNRLFFWRLDAFYIFRDSAPAGEYIDTLGRNIINANAHLQILDRSSGSYVFDTPYRDTIDVYVLDAPRSAYMPIARFYRHRPRNGLFRCDLHPCPSPNGRRIALCSVQDGGRQLYMLERDGDDAA